MLSPKIQNLLTHTILKMGFEPDKDATYNSLICKSPYIEICIYNDGGYVYDKNGNSFDYYYPEDSLYLTNDGEYDEEFFINMVKKSKELLLQREIKKDFE